MNLVAHPWDVYGEPPSLNDPYEIVAGHTYRDTDLDEIENDIGYLSDARKRIKQLFEDYEDESDFADDLYESLQSRVKNLIQPYDESLANRLLKELEAAENI